MSIGRIRNLLFQRNKIVTTGNYTVVNESLVIVNKTVGAATTITLPPSLTSPLGIRQLIVEDGKGDAATNNITITAAGTDTINGAATYVLSLNYGQATLTDLGGGKWTAAGAAPGGSVLSQQTPGADGLFATNLRLGDFTNADGSVLAAAASAGKFGYGVTLGTSFGLVGEVSNNNSKTDDAIIEYVLPAWYVAGQNLTVTVNAGISTAGAPTYATKSAQVLAYRTASNGTQGADIGPGAASAITVAGADIPFTITGTTLNPGDKVVFKLETVLHDTGAVACNAVINSFRVS